MENHFIDSMRVSIPISPVIHAALRAIYAGGAKSKWSADMNGRPLYRYQTRSGNITFYCSPPPDFGSRFHRSIAIYYAPRLGFIYSGEQRQAVQNLSVETADIFLILMSKIAQLKDPSREIAWITLDEIARLRGVRVRHGSSRNLHDVFKHEVMRLADLRLSMLWKDYRRGGEIIVGKDRPDRLLDILDIEYKRDGEKWLSFRFRCGQALAHFINPEGMHWLGYYSRYLLHLSPYHEAFTKKLGTYWILVGTIAEKKGSLPKATPKTIIDFCGETINWKHPGSTVDAFIESHQRLVDLGVIQDIPVLEPVMRNKGYFREWLDLPLTVKLSEEIWRIPGGTKKSSPPLQLGPTAYRKRHRQQSSRASAPKTTQELVADPSLIRRFRAEHYFRQDTLARILCVTRQTLSKYERGLRPLPEVAAGKIIRLWHTRAE
jgi:DNA-binding XRE family transcriptional regulator